MKTFHLQYRTASDGEDFTVRFDGDDPHRAFGILEKLKGACSARLWEGERSLGLIRRNDQNLWEITRHETRR